MLFNLWMNSAVLIAGDAPDKLSVVAGLNFPLVGVSEHWVTKLHKDSSAHPGDFVS